MASSPATGERKRVVIIAVDTSKHSDEAFAYYCQYLHQANNEVIILHCPELSSVHMRMLKGEQVTDDEWDKMIADEKDRWSALQKKYEYLLKEKNINGRFEVAPSNKPGEAIVKNSNENGAAMIITGTRGLGTLRRTVMGSVSDYIVHHSAVPVIVYRPSKK